GDEADAAFGKRGDQCLGGIGRRRHGARQRKHQRDVACAAYAGSAQVVVQHQRAFARRRWAFVRRPHTPTMACPREGGQHIAKPKTKASLRSIRVTSTWSPSDSDRIVLSSMPPKPAPRTVTRVLIGAPRPRNTAAGPPRGRGPA